MLLKCYGCVHRPPSTATVIGVQGDAERLLEERKGGDTQKAFLGKTNFSPPKMWPSKVYLLANLGGNGVVLYIIYHEFVYFLHK